MPLEYGYGSRKELRLGHYYKSPTAVHIHSKLQTNKQTDKGILQETIWFRNIYTKLLCSKRGLEVSSFFFFFLFFEWSHRSSKHIRKRFCIRYTRLVESWVIGRTDVHYRRSFDMNCSVLDPRDKIPQASTLCCCASYLSWEGRERDSSCEYSARDRFERFWAAWFGVKGRVDGDQKVHVAAGIPIP